MTVSLVSPINSFFILGVGDEEPYRRARERRDRADGERIFVHRTTQAPPRPARLVTGAFTCPLGLLARLTAKLVCPVAQVLTCILSRVLGIRGRA